MYKDRLHLGTSGFVYPDWIGTVWPGPLREEAAFAFYKERFDSVELNRTFYHVPRPETVERYRRWSGPNFVWSVKAPKRYSHGNLWGAEPEVLKAFYDRVEPLAQNGVILFQLPPRLTFDVTGLRAFLSERPDKIRMAVEFRHNSWFQRETYAALEQARAALVWVDAPGITRVWDVRTAEFAYFRLHGSEQWYRHRYTPAELDLIEETARRGLREGELFLYFDNTMQGHGFHNARELAERLER